MYLPFCGSMYWWLARYDTLDLWLDPRCRSGISCHEIYQSTDPMLGRYSDSTRCQTPVRTCQNMYGLCKTVQVLQYLGYTHLRDYGSVTLMEHTTLVLCQNWSQPVGPSIH